MKIIFTIICFFVFIKGFSQTKEEVLKELYKQEIPCAKIVLNQARLETGNFSSILCKKYKNLFGIKHNGKYAHYKNWKESVIDYKKKISSRYHKGENYYNFLIRINYAKDKNYIKKLKSFNN